MRAVILALAWALAGCGAYTTYKHTHLPARGTTEWVLASQLSGASTELDVAAPMPELVVGARRRVHERADVGLTGTLLPLGEVITTASLEASTRVVALRRGRYTVAAGLGAGYRITTSSGAIVEGVHVAAPLIVGIDLGRHQLVLSPTAGYQRHWSTGARPVGIPFAGYALGFRWQVTRRWALLPEAGWAASPARNFMSDDSRLFHLGVAALWTR